MSRPYGVNPPRTRQGRERRAMGFWQDIGKSPDRYRLWVNRHLFAVLKRCWPQPKVPNLVFAMPKELLK